MSDVQKYESELSVATCGYIKCCLQLHAYEEALFLCDKMLNILFNDYMLLLMKGLLLLKMCERERAKSLFDEMTALSTDAETLYDIGKICQKALCMDMASTYYEMCIRISPTYKNVQKRLRLCRSVLGNSQERGMDK